MAKLTKNNKLLEEAKSLVYGSESHEISYVGVKPWYSRAVSKFKFGMATGMATGLIAGLAGFGAFSSADLAELKDTTLLSNLSVGKLIDINAEKLLVSSTNNKSVVENNGFESALNILKKEHVNINFTDIENQRDVSKAFLGKNNFIALAAEMEGFRGDLHKDPATGLNIGFGYNISKRIGSSTIVVVNDLSAIGLSHEKIQKILDIAKLPQNKLNFGIKEFNKGLASEDKQLITIKQGVALLKRTQAEYKEQARLSFEGVFDKMGKHQQEVLTYAAYKAGYDALSQYKKAIRIASSVYAKNKNPGMAELKTIAKELTFYYRKDGNEMVLDERAKLIAQTFVNQDYLGVQIGKKDGLTNSLKNINKQKIDFLHLKTNLTSESSNATKVAIEIKQKPDIGDFLNKLRDTNKESSKHKIKQG